MVWKRDRPMELMEMKQVLLLLQLEIQIFRGGTWRPERANIDLVRSWICKQLVFILLVWIGYANLLKSVTMVSLQDFFYFHIRIPNVKPLNFRIPYQIELWSETWQIFLEQFWGIKSQKSIFLVNFLKTAINGYNFKTISHRKSISYRYTACVGI